jgi:hypothetical protein
MPVDLRKITSENLSEAIRLMNESSRGMSFEWQLDLFSFLALFRYWNFSGEHSLIGYAENEPAGLIITCTDPESCEAYIVYWGALPKFRTQRISIALFDACCKKLRADGYTLLHGVSVPDRPVRRYRFIQAHPQLTLFDMRSDSPELPAVNPAFEIRQVGLDLLSHIPIPSGESLHWCHRRAFLQNSASFLQFLGAFVHDVPRAYAVALRASPNTTLLDLRSSESDLAAGHELLRWLMEHSYRPPFTATYVFEGSYAHRVLASSGFAVKRQFSTLTRNLLMTS